MPRCMENKTILITGATGLIGQAVIKALIAMENGPAKILALTRNKAKAAELFSGISGVDRIQWIEGDVKTVVSFEGAIDYILHGAAETGSKAFVEQPVEVIETAYLGTKNLLELAKQKQVSAFLFLSTMEIYGTPETDDKIDELCGTNLNTMECRSSYPEGKRLCESLCASYHKEYGVPAMVLRLTQTFGSGVRYDDKRVFAEFARCVIEKRDIVLKTKGETKRSYLSTEDAASAILTVLLKGEPGEAYNAANEDTYCSIYEMAQLVAKECAKGEISVRIEETDVSALGYAKTLHMNLDTTKLRGLGWEPSCDLVEIYERMIDSMKA